MTNRRTDRWKDGQPKPIGPQPFGSGPKKDKNKLEAGQRRAARFVKNEYSRESGTGPDIMQILRRPIRPAPFKARRPNP